MVNKTRTAGGLIKTGMTLSDEQMQGLEILARRRQTSKAAIARDAIRAYLARHLPEHPEAKAS